MTRAFRVLALTAAVIPIVATIGAPDPDALQRVVSRLFKDSRPDSGVTSVLPVHFDRSSDLDVRMPTIEFTPLAPQDFAPVALRIEPTDVQPPRLELPLAPAPAARSQPRGALLSSLYVSFATLQALDAHSTLWALDRGARESNPVMGSIAHNTPALLALKAGTAAGVIYMTDRVRRHNRMASIIIMAAANSAYATIVSRNYRIGSELGR